MNKRFETKFKTPVSLCESNGKLSIPAAVALFGDLASYHATKLKVGLDILSPKGLFWLAVKTKVKVHRLPSMMEEITAFTWPEKPNRIRCNRFYALKSEGELLIEGKTEWAIIDTNTGKLQRTDDIYEDGFEFSEDRVCEEPFDRFNIDLSNGENFPAYTVKSTDIDIGNHMNNAAYVRAFFGMLSCEEIEKLNIKEMEITYKTPCFEGETLTVKKVDGDGCFYLAMLHKNESIASIIKLVF